MIVDTHVHVLSDDAAKYPHHSKGPEGQSKWPPFTGEMLVQEMDEAGIDRALTVQAYHTYHFDNSYAIDIALKYPKRFQSVAVIDQSQPDAPNLVSELVANRGVRGLRMMKVRKNIYGDPQTFPLWERIRSLKIAICFNKIDTVDLPELKVILERFPEVPVALDHSWAGPLDQEDAPYSGFKQLMEFSRYPNLFLKIAPNITYDLIERKGDPKRFWNMVIEHYGANRLMWGSNYPAHWNVFGKVKPRLEIMRKELSYLSAEDQRWIFGESALRLWPGLR